MWKKTIWIVGADRPWITLDRDDENAERQLATIRAWPFAWYIAVDTPTVLVAFTKSKTEVWIYQKLI